MGLGGLSPWWLVEPWGDGEAVCALGVLAPLPGWRARRLILGNGVPPLLLTLTVFCMIKYASRGLYRRNHFLSVRLSGIQFIHTVVQPSPASISRTLFSLVKWKPCPH